MATSKGKTVVPVKPFTRASKAFIKWNLKHEGKNELHAGDDYWYRDNVFFHANTPSWRAVKGRNGMLVVLVRWCSFQAYKEFEGKVTAFNVPDLAVFSKYDGDLMEDVAEMHERIRWVMFSQVRSFADSELRRMTNKDVVAKHKTVNNKRDELLGHYRRYIHYSDLFGLRWAELPTMYLDNFDLLREQKANEWNDPAAKRQRERGHARKQAVKALDLDKE